MFIEAKNKYYDFDLVPAFWTWLEKQAKIGTLASTDLIYNELQKHGDELADWAEAHRKLIFRVGSHSKQVARYVDALYSWAEKQNFKREHIDKFFDGADPFLIGVAAETNSIVVTMEELVGKNSKKVKIPNACDHLEVTYENTFEMMRSLKGRFV